MPTTALARGAGSGEEPAAPQTVLVIDDEPVARVSLSARLKRLGYRVLEAVDGKAGVALLRSERPDLIIVDWMMPEMDGPTFCEQVRQDPDFRSTQLLLMTGHDQPQQIAEGLARGADDFLSKAASKQEIMARVQAGMRAATLVRTLERARDEIQRKQAALEHELQSAAQYVESLLPEQGDILPGVELVHAYRPSRTLGGDLFNVVHWDPQTLGLYLLDASGHGVSPALRSASLSTFLRGDSLAHQVGSNDPGTILTEANRRFPLTEDGDYFTIVFVRLDLAAHGLAYASAGHGGAFLHRRSGELVWLTRPGLPLGFDPASVYPTVDVLYEPGDRLYLFSDGLYEVPGPAGELWGQQRLQEAVTRMGRRPMRDVIPALIGEASRWLGHDLFPDDVAVMGVTLHV